jgi:hypothetical protein
LGQALEEPKSRERLSAHRRARKEKFADRKRRSSDSGTSSRRVDTCSHDSGVFTSLRYENVDFAPKAEDGDGDGDEDEDEEGCIRSRNVLLHKKNSLTILEECAMAPRAEARFTVSDVENIGRYYFYGSS